MELETMTTKPPHDSGAGTRSETPRSGEFAVILWVLASLIGTFELLSWIFARIYGT
jgi:hypothetical protein